MYISSRTTSGKRKNNEDTLFAKKEGECLVLAVADGMGGHAGGEEASKIVAEVIKDNFNQFSNNPSWDKIRTFLNRIVEESHSAIRDKGKNTEDLKGLGTTLTILLGYKGKFAIGNIGDSRAYILNGENINQITEDHTYYSQYKKLNPEKNISKSMKERYNKILTKCIDGKGNDCDIFPEDKDFFELNKDEIVMLCSDGLIIDNGKAIDEQIKNVINNSQSLQDASVNLLDYAYDNGSKDNISVALTSKKQKLSTEISKESKDKEKSPDFKEKLAYYKPALSFLLTSILILILLIFAIFQLMDTLGENYNKQGKIEKETVRTERKA